MSPSFGPLELDGQQPASRGRQRVHRICATSKENVGRESPAHAANAEHPSPPTQPQTPNLASLASWRRRPRTRSGARRLILPASSQLGNPSETTLLPDTGAELERLGIARREVARVSRLKRRYGLDRSRLKGNEGWQIWTESGILAYNADTLA